MIENSPFRRTVVFVDGYSTLEVILGEDGSTVPCDLHPHAVPEELLHTPASAASAAVIQAAAAGQALTL